MPTIGGGGGGAGASGLCAPWATDADVCAPCSDYDFLDMALLDRSLQVASEVLYDFTGRRWPGECSDTIRPCSCECHLLCTCGCEAVSQITLPGSPAVSIDEVKVDGVVLSEGTDYRLDDGRHLVRLPDADGKRQRWPSWQRLDLDDDQPDTWSVAYTWGMAPPAGGVAAAATLGCQLALSCTPGQEGVCRLPKRVTSITRQGVSMAILDPLTLFADGQTGLADVDMWVASTFVGAKRRRAGVYVPGRGRSIRRTG